MLYRNKSKAALAKTNQNKSNLEILSNSTLGSIIEDINSLKTSNNSIVNNLDLLGENISSSKQSIVSNTQAIQAIQQTLSSIQLSIENINNRLSALEAPAQ